MKGTLWIAFFAALVSCYANACYASLRIFSRKKLEELLSQRERSDQFQPFIDRIDQVQLMVGIVRAIVNMIVLLAVLHYVQYSLWPISEPGTRDDLWAQYLTALLIAGTLVSIFGVAISSSWARYRAENLLAASLPFINIALHVFLPIANLLHLTDPLVRRISGVDEKPTDGDEQLSEELISVVEEHEKGDVDESQRQMIEAVVEFRSTTAGEIMTPRTDVVAIPVEATLEDIRHAVIVEGHSRVPVYDETIDHVVGILYARDLIAQLGSDKPLELRKTLREVLMVPESKSVRDLLAEFKSKKVHIAIVLDEYGGTAGLVTIEDVLEELVGEIEDEYEQTEERPSIRRLDDHSAEVDGRVYIDDLNDEMDLELPEDEDYDTVGGYVFSTLGHVPAADETFERDGVRVTVTEADRTKVVSVRIEALEHSENEEGDGV
ncbi:MAG: CBS domain-containing protein [Phycisphaera sp.]|nr:CBS domain-containing protein [Phycisphaera sp.]